MSIRKLKYTLYLYISTRGPQENEKKTSKAMMIFWELLNARKNQSDLFLIFIQYAVLLPFPFLPFFSFGSISTGGGVIILGTARKRKNKNSKEMKKKKNSL